MGNINTVGPNEVLVISGGWCFGNEKKMIIGSWGWSWWCVSDVQRLALGVMTLNPRSECVETAQGVPLTVTGVAQVKVMTDHGLLEVACEQFLGKSVEHIEEVILQTLEGHLRAILGTMSVEAVYQDRDSFAQLVREVAAPDLGRMGMEILSFTIKDVVDNVEYLESLGKAQTAIVKRDAAIGVAEADRDAGIIEAECEKSAADAKYDVEEKIADAKRELDIKQAEFDAQVSTKKAEAELAYDVQKARLMQAIREEEIKIDIVERHKNIQIEKREAERVEQELFATVRLPAEADAYKAKTIVLGERNSAIAIALAEAEATKRIGEAEASVIELIGKAEAERLRVRAEALKDFEKCATMAMVLEKIPEIAESITKPLRKTTEVLVVSSNDGIIGKVTNLAATIPPSLKAVTGVDLADTLMKIVKVRD